MIFVVSYRIMDTYLFDLHHLWNCYLHFVVHSGKVQFSRDHRKLSLLVCRKSGRDCIDHFLVALDTCDNGKCKIVMFGVQ